MLLYHVLNTIYSHFEKPGACIRLMFYDFSGAFNAKQPRLLADKLMKMNVDAYIIL